MIAFPSVEKAASPAWRAVWPEPATLRGRRVEAVARHVDLVPTLLDYLGIERPSPLHGESLLPLITGDYEVGRIIHTRNGSGSQVATGDGRWKLLLEPASGRAHLFDLKRDPGETSDVADRHPEELERLLAVRRSYRTKILSEPTVFAEPVPLDSELREALRSLGYAIEDQESEIDNAEAQRSEEEAASHGRDGKAAGGGSKAEIW